MQIFVPRKFHALPFRCLLGEIVESGFLYTWIRLKAGISPTMKKRTTAIAAALCLMPLGQPLLIATSVVLTSAAVMLATPQSAQAESGNYYIELAKDAMRNNDFHSAIRYFTEAIYIDPRNISAYEGRGLARHKLEGFPNHGTCSDYKKAVSLGSKDSYFLVGLSWCKKPYL